ncbi:hypothetical protein P1X14_09655 [Sphingomonas sp. AOB5]|uniref:hypothetical protein n=1 Tax=Sphingomonas sp. AOB5 TaxID=3034017 RepID=UPI0023F7C5AA|nr:hypothetical protein [Sphingomonas sp. AOB5]MDF7775511.1 hypothetical protein [Sphingomonas sp. AOB5]
MIRLPLIAFVPALALAACNQAEQTTDNALVDVGNATDVNDSAFEDGTLVEDAGDGDTAAVTVAAVPAPAAGASAGESAPLVEASDIEAEIRGGSGIERIRYGDGWAWRREGRIVRTADRDGGNVAYFRRGEDRPFFVQRGDRSYAYQGDKPVREFDRDGRARTPDADRTREAVEASRDAGERRNRAENARNRAGSGDRDDRGPRRPGATPSPSPTPSASPTPRGRDGREGRPDWKDNRPTPSPQSGDRPRRDREE